MSEKRRGRYNTDKTSYGVGCVASGIISSDLTITHELCQPPNSTILGNLKVDGSIECENLGPLGPLEKCDGCEQGSYGFKWELTDENQGEEACIERQMCFECLYEVMLIEKVRKREHERKQNSKS